MLVNSKHVRIQRMNWKILMTTGGHSGKNTETKGTGRRRIEIGERGAPGER